MARERLEADTDEVKRELRLLDGIVPEGVHRRNFLKGVAGMTLGGSLAGCASQESTPTESSSSGNGDTSSGQDFIDLTVKWRTNWAPTPHYSAVWVGYYRGDLGKFGIKPPSVLRGFSSGDSVKRTLTGRTQIGRSNSITTVLGGLQEQQDGQVYYWNTCDYRSSWVVVYREDVLPDGVQQLEEGDKSVGLGTAQAENFWPIFAEKMGINPENIETQTVRDTAKVALLAEGEIDALMATFNDTPPMKKQIEDRGGKMGIEFLDNHIDSFGAADIVNPTWVEETDRSVEYLGRLASGYSHAAHWVMLHPEETIDLMQENIVESLQGQDRDVLIQQMYAGALALNYHDDVKANGVGYMTQDQVAGMIDTMAPAMGISDAPAAEDMFLAEVQEQREGKGFTNDEWSQIEETASEWIGYL